MMKTLRLLFRTHNQMKKIRVSKSFSKNSFIKVHLSETTDDDFFKEWVRQNYPSSKLAQL